MSNGIEINKMAGALFLAGIVAMVAGFMADGLYKGTISEHEPEIKRGYTIEGAEVAGEAGGEAPKDEAPVDILPLLAKADLKGGEAQLKKCTACHTFDKGGKNGVGPNQYGLVGRGIASHAGYAYSEALSGMKSKNWNFQELSDFLAAPKKYAAGNKMSFAGIKNPQDRANLIAYLNTLSDKPLPLPK